MTYSPGHASTFNGAVRCGWGAADGTLVLRVTVEPDAATAKADYSASLASEKRAYLVEPLPNFADGAFIVRSSPNMYAQGGIDVLAGTTFFDISYLKGTIPSDAQLKDAATPVKGRLP